MRRSYINFRLWTTLFTLDDCSRFLHVTRFSLAELHILEELTFCRNSLSTLCISIRQEHLEFWTPSKVQLK